MAMRRNVGGPDRAVRVAVGLILLPIGLVMLAGHCVCGWVNVVLGLAGLASGISGFCVLYLPFGISTAQRTSVAPR
jgi:hypothetical protein